MKALLIAVLSATSLVHAEGRFTGVMQCLRDLRPYTSESVGQYPDLVYGKEDTVEAILKRGDPLLLIPRRNDVLIVGENNLYTAPRPRWVPVAGFPQPVQIATYRFATGLLPDVDYYQYGLNGSRIYFGEAASSAISGIANSQKRQHQPLDDILPPEILIANLDNSNAQAVLNAAVEALMRSSTIGWMTVKQSRILAADLKADCGGVQSPAMDQFIERYPAGDNALPVSPRATAN